MITQAERKAEPFCWWRLPGHLQENLKPEPKRRRPYKKPYNLPSQFTAQERLIMRLQAYALLHLARTGWLPNQEKWFR